MIRADAIKQELDFLLIGHITSLNGNLVPTVQLAKMLEPLFQLLARIVHCFS